MKLVTPNQIIVQHDIYRYKKNKLASMLALLGIVFNCLFFCLLYGITSTFEDASATTYSWFVQILIGGSVILNLLMLLFGFFASEGIKVYNKKFSILLIVLAVIQFARIFIYPLYGLQNDLLRVTYFGYNPESSIAEFIIMTIYLCASAACFATSAVIGYIRAVSLEKHVKAVESGEIDIESTLDSMDDEDAKSAALNNTTEEVPNA